MKSTVVGCAIIVMLFFSISRASALMVDVDGTVIVDGGLNDLDFTPNNNQILFDSVISGFPTFSGFAAQGKVDIITGTGSSLNIGTAAVARLTDLVVDVNGAVTPNQFRIVFEHNFGGVTQGPANAADQIDDAFSHDGTTAATFLNNTGAVPLLPAEDFMVSWQGFVDNVAIPNPSGTPPFPNLAGLNQAYPLYGHADPLMFGGLVYTPTLRGELTIELGGSRNQFILLNSAEVGIATAIPEPATMSLLVVGVLSLGFYAWRRRRRAMMP